MKNRKHIFKVIVLLIMVVIISACSQPSTSNQPIMPTTPTPNKPTDAANLTVDAGADQEITVGQSIVLDGSQSTKDALYTWTLVEKPTASKTTLQQSSAVKIRFQADVSGDYVIELELTSGTTSKSDQVTIKVKEFSRTGIISSDKPLTAEDGISLTSPAGIAATDVLLKPMDKLGVPLPSIYTAVGNSYSLSSKSLLKAAANTYFELALPVPDNSPKDNLALAVLIPAEHQYGLLKKGEVFQDSWVIVDSQLDTGKNKALSAIHMLVPEELQLTLVTHPSFSNTARSLNTLAQSSEHFEVRCSGEFDDDDITTNCSGTTERTAVNAIESIFVEYVDKGFTDEPALRRSFFIGNYVIDIVPSNKPWLGLYTPVLNSIQVTLSQDGTFDGTSALNEVAISRHEYFHAVQFSYLNPIQTAQVAFNNWSLEGQATAVMNSQNDIQRFSAGFIPRDIETSLLENSFDNTSAPPYEAHDFWVFVAKSINNNISALLRFVTRGHTVGSVDDAFRNSNAAFPTLADAYWAWAKNQAFEASVDIGIGATQCTLNTQTVRRRSIESFRPFVNERGVASNVISIPTVLEALSSEVITLNLAHDENPNYVAYAANISANAGSNFNDLFEFKIYDETSNASQSCADMPDGRRSVQAPRLRADGGPNNNQQVHILISNTSDRRLAVDVLVDALVDQLASDEVALNLIHPTVTRIREGTRVNYEVEAVSPNVDSTLAWFINNERVREDAVPRGRDSYSLDFVPCPQETTLRAVLLERLAGNQIVTHTMEVIPFGEAILDTEEEGRYLGIITEADIIRARITAATCNDPDSRGVNLLDVQWKIDGKDAVIDKALKFAKDQLKGGKIFAELGMSYPSGKPEVSSKLTVYDCDPKIDLTTANGALSCLSYKGQQATDELYSGLELTASIEEATGILQTTLSKALKDRGVETKTIGMSRNDSLSLISSKFSKNSADVLSSLFTALASSDVATFDTKFKQLHTTLAKEQFSASESELILEAMSLVMTQVDEYTSRADGGNNRWSQLLFVQDPDALVGRVNELAPAAKALETYLSVVATTGEVSSVDEIVNVAAAGVALQSTKVSIGTTF